MFTLLLLCSSATVADIVFLMDDSSKMGSKNLQLIGAILLKIVNALDIGPSNVGVWLVLGHWRSRSGVKIRG